MEDWIFFANVAGILLVGFTGFIAFSKIARRLVV